MEAAHRTDKTKTDSLIAKQNWIEKLIQSGIENPSGGDITEVELAEWARRLVKIEFSQHEIAWRTSIPVVIIIW